MIRSRWRRSPRRRMPARRLLLAAVAVLVPVLAGCEAGNAAPTLRFHYPTDSAGVAKGRLSIRNVFVLGAPLGKNLTRGQSASLFLSLINNGPPDRLVGITAPGSASAVVLPAGGIPVTSGHPVFYSGPRPRVIVRGLTRTVRSGSTIKMRLIFLHAAPVTLAVPVFPRAAQYADLQPPPAPAPATPSPTTHPGRAGG